MNHQLIILRGLLLDLEQLVSNSAISYDSNRRLAIQSMITAEAKAHQLKQQISEFLETNHYPEN